MAGKFNRTKLNNIVLLIVVPLLIILFIAGSNMKYKVEGGGVKIKWITSINIPADKIKEVQILDKTPGMNRVFGMDMISVKQGTYTLEGIGRVKMYANNIKRKLVLIKTDDTVYAITPENPEEFKKSIGR
jgi:hypothetical protein